MKLVHRINWPSNRVGYKLAHKPCKKINNSRIIIIILTRLGPGRGKFLALVTFSFVSLDWILDVLSFRSWCLWALLVLQNVHHQFDRQGCCNTRNTRPCHSALLIKAAISSWVAWCNHWKSNLCLTWTMSGFFHRFLFIWPANGFTGLLSSEKESLS